MIAEKSKLFLEPSGLVIYDREVVSSLVWCEFAVILELVKVVHESLVGIALLCVHIHYSAAETEAAIVPANFAPFVSAFVVVCCARPSAPPITVEYGTCTAIKNTQCWAGEVNIAWG